MSRFVGVNMTMVSQGLCEIKQKSSDHWQFFSIYGRGQWSSPSGIYNRPVRNLNVFEGDELRDRTLGFRMYCSGWVGGCCAQWTGMRACVSLSGSETSISRICQMTLRSTHQDRHAGVNSAKQVRSVHSIPVGMFHILLVRFRVACIAVRFRL